MQGWALTKAGYPPRPMQTRYLILLALGTAALILVASAAWFVGLGT